MNIFDTITSLQRSEKDRDESNEREMSSAGIFDSNKLELYLRKHIFFIFSFLVKHITNLIFYYVCSKHVSC